jgi:peptide/nickel transport system permease protein
VPEQRPVGQELAGDSRRQGWLLMAFIARRLVFYLVAAWVALTVNFFIPRAMPGSAVQDIMSKFPNLQPSAYKALQAMLGVGHPGSLWHQYGAYLVDVFHFNFGTDVVEYPAQVSTLLGETIPWTLTLVGTATVIAFFVGTGLGIVAGWRHGGPLDRVLPGLMFLQAIPYFFLALILVELLAVNTNLFPLGQGYAGGLIPGWHWAFIGSAIYHSVLPAFTIVITSLAGWMLQMRNVMITTIGEDYVLAATAKGLSPRRIMFTYAARNAILPNIAGFALAIGFVVAGALVTEIVFSYPGVGYQLYTAVQNDDIPTMQGIFLAFSAAVLLACLLADVVYVLADPRTRTRAAY